MSRPCRAFVRLLLVVVAAMLAVGPARADDLPACRFDRRTPEGLWLVTFAPGTDLTSVFGHTLLLDYDPRRGEESLTYDFGHFDPNAPDFLWNFVANQQDYTLETRTLGRTRRTYSRRDRDGIAQRLDLDPRAHRELVAELERRMRDEGGIFRYHWYHSNCTTEVRDAIAEVVPGLESQHLDPSGSSPRREVLRHSAPHPLWFGLHWGSGGFADQEISHWDRMFMPVILMERLRASTVDGHPLVAEECQLIDGNIGFADPAPPRRDGVLFAVGAVLAGLFAGLFRFAPRAARYATGGWGVVTGILGCAALLIGVMGTFAPFWGGHGLALASPLHLLLIPAAVAAARRGEAAPGRFELAVAALIGGTWALGLLWAAVRLNADFALGLFGLFLANPVVAAGLAGRIRPAGSPRP